MRVAKDSRKAQPRLLDVLKEWEWKCREASNFWTSTSVDRGDRVVLGVPYRTLFKVYWRSCRIFDA